MTPATRQPDALAKAKSDAALTQANDALKLLGSAVGSKLYEEVAGVWRVRFALWFHRGDCRVEDVKAACEALSAPAGLARIKFASDLNAELSAAIDAARVRRERREEMERQRARDAQPYDPAQRAFVLKTLAGMGRQIGKGRTPNPRSARRGNQAEKPAARQTEEAGAGQDAAEEAHAQSHAHEG